MARAVVDATVGVAFADTDDDDHERGTEIVRAIDRGGLVTGISTHDALLELLNYVNEQRPSANGAPNGRSLGVHGQRREVRPVEGVVEADQRVAVYGRVPADDEVRCDMLTRCESPTTRFTGDGPFRPA